MNNGSAAHSLCWSLAFALSLQVVTVHALDERVETVATRVAKKVLSDGVAPAHSVWGRYAPHDMQLIRISPRG